MAAPAVHMYFIYVLPAGSRGGIPHWCVEQLQRSTEGFWKMDLRSLRAGTPGVRDINKVRWQALPDMWDSSPGSASCQQIPADQQRSGPERAETGAQTGGHENLGFGRSLNSRHHSRTITHKLPVISSGCVAFRDPAVIRRDK